MDAEKTNLPEARMGEPGDLARFIGGEYRKQSFRRRHPVVTFAVMPVLLLLGIWAGLMALDYLIVSMLPGVAGSVVDGPTSEFVMYGINWVVVALTTLVFCRAARHGQMDWRWSLVAAAILAFFLGMTVSFAPSLIYIGFHPAITVARSIQIMLPLAIGGWYTWKGCRLQGAW